MRDRYTNRKLLNIGSYIKCKPFLISNRWYHPESMKIIKYYEYNFACILYYVDFKFGLMNDEDESCSTIHPNCVYQDDECKKLSFRKDKLTKILNKL